MVNRRLQGPRKLPINQADSRIEKGRSWLVGVGPGAVVGGVETYRHKCHICQHPLSNSDLERNHYNHCMSYWYCAGKLIEKQEKHFLQRQKQMELVLKEVKKHIHDPKEEEESGKTNSKHNAIHFHLRRHHCRNMYLLLQLLLCDARIQRVLPSAALPNAPLASTPTKVLHPN
eukprot:jgi/Psemu1/38296/gm1.38296_g